MHNTDGAPKRIKIHGARVHNLKNINVEIPLNQIVGIAGVSGSGKSSLALGVVYAEGSRRYLESGTGDSHYLWYRNRVAEQPASDVFPSGQPQMSERTLCRANAGSGSRTADLLPDM